MQEIDVNKKNKTIAIDFDGVIHKYSKGYLGQQNVYDEPTEGTHETLKELKRKGYHLIIVSSRPVEPIRKWLRQNDLLGYFDDITNTKRPALVYVDDKAWHFERGQESSWIELLKYLEDL